jgi:tetratricopeptide (TPR) repeat protein
MFDELLQEATHLRSNAQDKRRKARAEADEVERRRLFAAAEDEFSEAILALERGLRSARRQQQGYTADICRLLEALSQTYGSLGGTWRDAGDRRQAREKYDKGNEYEEQRRQHCGAMDTYNMLQRLVIRLLEAPGRLHEPDFRKDMDEVRSEIEREVEAGRDDSWAMADLVLASFLSGMPADAAIAFLERRNAEANFYESAYNGVATLVNEGLGKDVELGRRLEDFMRLLKRKGGLR